MKIVQTSWTGNQIDYFKFRAGWYSPEYNLMAWTLSCLQLKKYYDQVILYADEVSARTFIDVLKLPYSEVCCDLDQFNHLPAGLWGLTKIYTYSQQSEPFLHVDGDVFIFKPFENLLLQGGLIAQNLEIATKEYDGLFEKLESQLITLSVDILEAKKQGESIYAYNAGIFGGNDLDFIQLFTKTVKKFVYDNTTTFSTINLRAFNIYFEQYLFYCMTRKLNKTVNVLFSEVIPDNRYIGFGDFLSVPYNKQYLHLIGLPYKQNESVCQQLANRLRQDYPEYYYRIISLFKSKRLHIQSDFYFSINNPTEKFLVDRYNFLRFGRNSNGTFNSRDIKYTGKKLPFKRLRIVDNLLVSMKSKIESQEKEFNYDKIIEDAKAFEAQLTNLLESKFSEISIDELYTRDITHIQYFETLFSDTKSGFDKFLVAHSNIEIIECTKDWSIFDRNIINGINYSSVFENNRSSNYLCVIPECDSKGYSLLGIDLLDMELMRLWHFPKTISEILIVMKSAFDADDFNESQQEFEILIIGRIKKMLKAKIIKIINSNN